MLGECWVKLLVIEIHFNMCLCSFTYSLLTPDILKLRHLKVTNIILFLSPNSTDCLNNITLEIFIIVAFFENTTIEYSSKSVCLCARVCVCLCVCLHDNSKRKRSRNMKLEYIVVCKK